MANALALLVAAGFGFGWPLAGLVLVAVTPVFYLNTLSTSDLTAEQSG